MHTLVKQILFGNFEGGHTPPEEILQNRKHSDLTLLKAEMCLWTRNIRIMFFEDKQNHLIVWASEGHAKANFLCSKLLAFAYFNTNGRFLEHISTYHRGFPNLYPSGTQRPILHNFWVFSCSKDWDARHREIKDFSNPFQNQKWSQEKIDSGCDDIFCRSDPLQTWRLHIDPLRQRQCLHPGCHLCW